MTKKDWWPFQRAEVLFSMVLCLIILSLSGCKQKVKQVAINLDDFRKEMLEANQRLVQSESHQIDSFIQQHAFHMDVTGTGLRFEIIKAGKQRKTQPDDEVAIRYKAWLLNGTLCLETKSDQPEVLKLGRNMQIKGVEEALLMMTEGETVRIIVPSYLAYGMKGNGDLIPAAVSLYYELNLIGIK